MDKKIPMIIHQIWSGIDKPLPQISQVLGNTWKRDYPEWKYILWDNTSMNQLIENDYPQYKSIYKSFEYNIQRWDAIRYLILYKFGGMYVDFDYESIKPLEPIVKDQTCCFAEEPEAHKLGIPLVAEKYFNNAMMISIPNHPFMKKIIDSVFTLNDDNLSANSSDYVLQTTGPWKLIKLYKTLDDIEKKQIFIIPSKYVSPFNVSQSRRFLLNKERSNELESCLSEAYAVHYFFGYWRKEIKV